MNILNVAKDEFTEKISRVHPLIVEHLVNGHHRYQPHFDTPDNFIKQNKKFLYIYPFGDLNPLSKSELPIPPKNVVEYIRRGRAHLVFLYPNEGNLREKRHIKPLMELVDKLKLDNTNCHIFCSNMRLKDAIKNHGFNINKINVEDFCYFEFNPWFLQNFRLNNEDLTQRHIDNFSNMLKERNKSRKFYFNCLNRLPRPHRILLYCLVYKNKDILNKSIISLGPPKTLYFSEFNPGLFKRPFIKLNNLEIFEDFLKENQERWTTTGMVIDEDLNINQAMNLNTSFYENSYITITTETETDDNQLFFSEKTFKPIVAGHPFLFIGNQFSLAKLRDMGYKTFDRWWDESYDEEEDYALRTLKVFQIISGLAKLSKASLELLVEDMQSVLIHNQNIFFNHSREDEFYSKLMKLTEESKHVI